MSRILMSIEHASRGSERCAIDAYTMSSQIDSTTLALPLKPTRRGRFPLAYFSAIVSYGESTIGFKGA